MQEPTRLQVLKRFAKTVALMIGAPLALGLIVASIATVWRWVS